MDLLLELMRKSGYRDADQSPTLEWRSVHEWKRSMFGGRPNSLGRRNSKADRMVGGWLEELSRDGLVDRRDQGEGIVLYRAVLG